MITNLNLKNFQKWKSLNVELDQITTIVGTSDQGKSATIRALFWLCFNKPAGTAFIRHGSDPRECRVAITCDDTRLRRTRGKRNLFRIGKRKLVSAGSGVPDEWESILNVSRHSFQLQHDAPFWLGLTGTAAAKELNQVYDLSVVDKLNAAISKRVRYSKARVDVLTDTVAQNERDISELRWAIKASKCIKRIERLETKRNKKQKRYQAIERRVLLIKDIQSKLKTIETAVAIGDKLQKKMNEVKTLVIRCDRLERMISRIENLQQRIEDTNIELATKKKKLKKYSKGICPVCNQTLP